jgi:hypothetical protein
MGIKEALGFGSNKIRYAIVGVGDIAQEDMMPGVEHTYNSIMTALVTSDSQKAQKLGAKYDIQATFTYEEFPQAPPEFSTQFMWRCRTGGMPNLSSLLCAPAFTCCARSPWRFRNVRQFWMPLKQLQPS